MFAPPFQYTSMTYPSDFIKIGSHILNKQKIINISKEDCFPIVELKDVDPQYNVVIYFENSKEIRITFDKKEERDKLFEDICENCFRQVSE